MPDISTRYLGLSLKNPIVPSSSPLSKNFDSALRLQEAGAGALVMHSLFEEQIEHEEAEAERFLHQQMIGHAEADSFHPMPERYRSYQDEYLEQLQRLKQGLDIPVIASLNGSSVGGWVDYGKALEEAGADALELNIYYVPAGECESASQVEQRYIDILHALREQVELPLTLKLSSQFSAPIHVVQRLVQAGAQGVALFNRFYQPDIDLDTLDVKSSLELSTPMESLLRIRWVAILYGRVNCSLAITGGVHNAESVIKGLLAGADVTHMCSVLLQRGPDVIAETLRGLRRWMEEREYSSVDQLKGSVSQQHAVEPTAYTRANYIQVLDSYSPSPGVWR